MASATTEACGLACSVYRGALATGYAEERTEPATATPDRTPWANPDRADKAADAGFPTRSTKRKKNQRQGSAQAPVEAALIASAASRHESGWHRRAAKLEYRGKY